MDIMAFSLDFVQSVDLARLGYGLFYGRIMATAIPRQIEQREREREAPDEKISPAKDLRSLANSIIMDLRVIALTIGSRFGPILVRIAIRGAFGMLPIVQTCGRLTAR